MYETAIKDLEHQMPVIVDEMHAQDVQHEAELAGEKLQRREEIETYLFIQSSPRFAFVVHSDQQRA